MKTPEVVNLSLDEKDLLLESLANETLSKEQREHLKAIVLSFTEVCLTAQQRQASILKIRKVLGIKTEKISKNSEQTEGEQADGESPAGTELSSEEKKRLLAVVMGGAGTSLFPSLRF